MLFQNISSRCIRRLDLSALRHLSADESAMTDPVRPTVRLRRNQALDLLVRGQPPAEVARTLGVSLRTLRRYLADGAILKELRRIQDERIEALLRASLVAAPDALDTLRTVAADADAPDRARVAAARAVLGHSLQLYEAADLARRVERLEEIAEEVTPRNRFS